MTDFVEVMQAYFRGEKLLGYGFVAIGVPMIGFAIFVFRSQVGGFRLGLAIPLALVGVLITAAGPFFVRRNAQLAEDIEARYAEDPPALAAAEGERMAVVNANWPRLKLAWAVIAVAAMAGLLLVKVDWVQGLALALLCVTTVLFFVDTFGERRAVPYTDALAAIDAPLEDE